MFGRKKVFVLFIGLVFGLGCGGGGDNPLPDSSVTDSRDDFVSPGDTLRPDGGDTLPRGSLHITTTPAVPGVTCQVFVDGVTAGNLAAGSDKLVEVAVGSHDVRLLCPGNCGADPRPCPGYGYVVAGYQFDSRFQPVSEWTMTGVQVNSTVEINATLCRDLTGRWQRETGVVRDAVISAGTDNRCWTSNMTPWQYWVEGNTATVQYVGPCGGTAGQVTDNGRLITVDCGSGNVLVYTRLD